MASFPVDKNRLQALVDRWNAQNPVNSTVIVKNYAEPKVTRSEAMVLFDRKAVIYLKDHNGYFDLEDVVPVENRGTEPSGGLRLETGIGHSRSARSRECFIFPGQGSQEKGMGKQLFEAYPELTKVADHILGYSIENLCLADSRQVLDHTEYTQPALYVVNALSYLHEREIRGLEPGFLAGHSLGEYSALFAAGVFDFETGLRLVQKRGALMAEAKGGGMAAVIGMDAPQTMKVLSDSGLDSIDIANINSPQQTVISGARADVERRRPFLSPQGREFTFRSRSAGLFIRGT